MKNLLRLLALAAIAALPAVSRAQPVYTSSDTGGGLSPTPFSSIQTFTGFESISEVTWTITNMFGVPQSTGFNAYVAEWNAGAVVNGTVTAFGALDNPLALGGDGTGGLTFTQNWTGDPGTTYALILSYFSGDGSLVTSTGVAPVDAFFSSGNAIFANTLSNSGSFLTDLENPVNMLDLGAGSAFAMSVTGITASPVPEPATAAASLAGLFVTALVGRRIRQRRKLAAVPVAA